MDVIQAAADFLVLWDTPAVVTAPMAVSFAAGVVTVAILLRRVTHVPYVHRVLAGQLFEATQTRLRTFEVLESEWNVPKMNISVLPPCLVPGLFGDNGPRSLELFGANETNINIISVNDIHEDIDWYAEEQCAWPDYMHGVGNSTPFFEAPCYYVGLSYVFRHDDKGRQQSFTSKFTTMIISYICLTVAIASQLREKLSKHATTKQFIKNEMPVYESTKINVPILITKGRLPSVSFRIC